jgi:ketosteroid isomerase-like protein
MATTRSVLEHHLQCFGTADLDGIMADYAPDAALLTAQGSLKGPDAIRGYFAAAFAEFSRPGTTFAMKTMLVDGDCAFILWDAETSARRYENATDTFVVRDGKIVAQTYAASVTVKQ